MSQNQAKISLQALVDAVPRRSRALACSGVSGTERAYLVSRVYLKHRLPLVVTLASTKEAERFLEDLRFFLPAADCPLLWFPPYNLQPFQHLAYHSETAARRVAILYRMFTDEIPPIVVTTVDALLQKIIPKREIADYADLVAVGEEIDRDRLVDKLISGGYNRTVIVEEAGDFCVRGGILDVFSPLYPDPLRIELFGDTVDALRFFSAATQRTVRDLHEAVLLPARETIIPPERLEEIITRVRRRASLQHIPVTRVRSLVERLRRERVFPGIESLLPLVYSRLDTLFDYSPEASLFVLIEPDALQAAAGKLQDQAGANYEAACSKDRLCVAPDELFDTWERARETLAPRRPLTLEALAVVKGPAAGDPAGAPVFFSVQDNRELKLALETQPDRENLLHPLADWIHAQREAGCLALLVGNSTARLERLKTLLEPYGIQPRTAAHFPDVERGRGMVYLCPGELSGGFRWVEEGLAVVTETEIFGKRRQRRKAPPPGPQSQLLTLGDLKQDDLVVHIEHGIGRYQGLVKLKLNGTANDFLLLAYKDDDKLYLPVDRMGMVQKYMGVDGVQPVLDKMGGKSWERVKDRVKKSVELIAGDLLKLYAARKVLQGHAFKTTDAYFRDFESGFAYEETPDQLRAIEDVLQDMERTGPMDRLVCGDVGYGKTEVALRASFVAVNEGKQVAVLVPTTVLAEQHFATFSQRFARYPVNLACLSRFRSAREQRAIIEGVKKGQVDIVIGTHRLLQKDVAFKELGLVVLDEEQRFGVKHKEKLKKLRATVDVLALTATPIPRTLHLSMMGIRDISLISTPPEDRHPIITYICEYDDAVIAEAIRKELSRKGQIFFVHNNIHSINKIARHLSELVPEVRLETAHGRMDEEALEKVMMRFLKQEIDMLVCTTIIESGLDIPSANTILVNRADRFGLAQMYQLRGRVGRGDEQAYAYLFVPGNSILGKDAQKRLKVLMEHSDLGSGFQIAMSDLQIRGGGTILGASQSGHIAAVGYDMFLRLMETAIGELKGEPVLEGLDPEINITLSAFIPEVYIPDIDQRLSAYRRLARMTELREIPEFREELIDRFGPLPEEGSNLLFKILLKVFAIKAGVKKLDLTGQQLALHISPEHQQNPHGVIAMVLDAQDRFSFTPDHVLKARLTARSTVAQLAETRNILKEMAQRANA